MISSETTVREVALQMPESTRLFEQLKIDYCCGGYRPLGDACASAGVDVAGVMQRLEELTQSQGSRAVDFQHASLPELIEHILNTHHVFTKSEMDRLESLIAKVISAHGTNHPELIHVGEVFKHLCDDLRPHMFKEEQILFPYILALTKALNDNRARPFAPFGTVNNPIRVMSQEHDAAGEMLRELRVLTSDYKVPADACISYQTLYEAMENFEKDLHQHIHLENNLLFPKALELENAVSR